VDELIVASRAIHFTAVALLFGVPLFRLAVVRVAAKDGVAGAGGIELYAGLAALLSGLGWFIGVAATMAGTWSDVLAPDILAAVADTRFGHLWIARLAAIVAILGVQVLARPSRARDIVLSILTAAFAASLVGVGHGMAGAGRLGWIHMAADMVHLLCAATWIGGLFSLGMVLRRTARGEAAPEILGQALPRFSRIGYGAVALLVISGCINAMILVPRPERLIGTQYGHVLLVKIALASLMIAIAVVNRVALTPKVCSGSVAALWRSVILEQGVGLLVLATVALLGTIHPVP
jgi:putative copper resistance protein D